jgi:hypothetical protein
MTERMAQIRADAIALDKEYWSLIEKAKAAKWESDACWKLLFKLEKENQVSA